MNKNAKKFLIILALTLLGIGLFKVNPVFAQTPLDVIFEKTPLFNEANFLPGENITRWIKVTNNSGENQKIAIEAINESDPDNFASQLNLTIKEGTTTFYNDTLAKFFSDGETKLSDLASGATKQYDLTIVFNPGSGNEYQEKRIGFDILIGFQGTEGQNNDGGGTNGGGGGGALPLQGLTISEESIAISNNSGCQSCSVTIIWTTGYFSTSEVIYDTIPGKFDFSLGPSKYGYDYLKGGDDSGLEKVTAHSVTITGLLPNTTYYYRVVSHASPPSISTEHKFITYVSENCVPNQIESGSEEGTQGTTILGSETGGNEEGNGGSNQNEGQEQEQTGGITQGPALGEEGNETGPETEEISNEEGEENPNFLSIGLASIIDALRKIFGEKLYLYLLSIFIVLSLLWLFLSFLKKKRQKEAET